MLTDLSDIACGGYEMNMLMNAPEWLVGLCIIATTVLAASGSFLVVNHLAHGKLSPKKGNLAVGVLGTLASLNALLLVITSR